jgi:acylphosphatase
VQQRVLVTVEGRVQGVGFRWWAMSQARELGLVGYAENLVDGRVEVCAQGEEEKVVTMVRRLIEQPTTTSRPGMVSHQTITWHQPDPRLTRFGWS